MRKVVKKPNIDDFLNFLRDDEQPLPPPPTEGNGGDRYSQEDEDPRSQIPPSSDEGEVRISPMTTTGNLLRFETPVDEDEASGYSSPFPVTKASRRYDNNESSGEEDGDEVEVELVSPDRRRSSRPSSGREENVNPPTFHIPLVPSRNRKRDEYDEIEGIEGRKNRRRDLISNLKSAERKQASNSRQTSISSLDDSEFLDVGSPRSKFTREEYEDEIIRLRKLVDEYKIRLSGTELELREYKSNSLHEGIFSQIRNFHRLNSMLHDHTEQVGLPPFPKFFEEVQNEGTRLVNVISQVVNPLIRLFVRRREELKNEVDLIREEVDENDAKMERSKKLKEEANRYKRVFKRFRLLTRKIHELQEYLDTCEFESVLGRGRFMNNSSQKTNEKKKKKGIMSRNIVKLRGRREGEEPNREQLEQILKKLYEEKERVKIELLKIRKEVESSSSLSPSSQKSKGNDVFPISSFTFDESDDEEKKKKKKGQKTRRRRRRRKKKIRKEKKKENGEIDLYDDFDYDFNGDSYEEGEEYEEEEEEEEEGEEEELKSPKISIVIEDRSSFVVETEKKMKEFTKKFESQFICPITQDVMKDPVILQETGQTFDRSAIETWLNQSSTCPITRKHLVTKKLIPNIALRSTIQEWEKQNKDWNEEELEKEEEEKKEEEKKRKKIEDIFWEDVFGDFTSTSSSSQQQIGLLPPPPPPPQPPQRPSRELFDDDDVDELFGTTTTTNRRRNNRRRFRVSEEEEEESESRRGIRISGDLFGDMEEEEELMIPRRRISESQRQREMNERQQLRIFFRDFQNTNSNNNNDQNNVRRINKNNDNNNGGRTSSFNWLDEIFQEEGRSLGNPAEGGSPNILTSPIPPPPPPPERNDSTSQPHQREISLPPFPGIEMNSSELQTTERQNEEEGEEEEEEGENDRYERSLKILKEMGFDERAANLLRQNNGDLETVVNIMIGDNNNEQNNNNENRNITQMK